MELQTLHPPGKRKKLWELGNGFQCSVIGTCFSFAELKKLNRKLKDRCHSYSNSFELHNFFSKLAAYNSVDARTVHKLLDQKFRKQILNVRKLRGDQEALDFWDNTMLQVDMIGTYWALLTHPFLSHDFTSLLYGRIHMYSHESVRVVSRTKVEADKLRQELQALRQAVKKEKIENRTKRKELENELNEVKKERNSLRRQTQSTLSPNGQDITPGLSTNFHLMNSEREYKVLVTQRDKMQKELETWKIRYHTLEKNHAIAQQTILAQEQEAEQLEDGLLRSKLSCSSCEKRDSDSCPGEDLCGKTILYVGGMHNMVPHYRKLVESSGAKFLHHDGGKEVAISRLPKMLAQADAVMCPVDCVSHDACLNVKKLCKQYQKQYVMMRSSGLSTLANSLTQL
jgi:hypothetical protein